MTNNHIILCNVSIYHGRYRRCLYQWLIIGKLSVAVNRVRVIVHREVVTSVACRDGYQGVRSILVTAGNYLLLISGSHSCERSIAPVHEIYYSRISERCVTMSVGRTKPAAYLAWSASIIRYMRSCGSKSSDSMTVQLLTWGKSADRVILGTNLV